MWTSPIGFVWVIVVGSVISLLWRQQQPWHKAGRSDPDPALFSPPLAARLRARSGNKSVQTDIALPH